MLFALAMAFEHVWSERWSEITAIVLFSLSYAVVGYDILWRALTNIVHGRIFDENFLMTAATVGAIALGELGEAVAVMLFYQVGELFQEIAVNKSRKSIAELMNIRPDYAYVVRDGETLKTDPYDVEVGETIVVKPGDRVPLDCVVTDGASSLDTSALTGESLPREVSAGSEVMSGCINMTGVIVACVSKPFGESTASKILELVENASDKKSSSENFITRFARVYTPIVVGVAVLLAVLPPLIAGGGWKDWIYRALSFLVVSCPCALVISVPLSFFGGIGGAGKMGILVKGSNYLEALAKTETVVFDKTGTLTEGRFEVAELNAEECFEKESVLFFAASAESMSTHPIARSIVNECGQEVEGRAEEISETAGEGVSARVDGHDVLAGNARLMRRFDIPFKEAKTAGTAVYVAVDGSFAGSIVIKDKIKRDSAQAVERLKKLGVKNTVMLSGDSSAIAREVAEKVGLDEVYAQLLPADKVERLEALLEKKTSGKTLVYVGDGLNDAPVLARADVGIAMGGVGSDSAIEAADVVIMTDEPARIADAVSLSRRVRRIVTENIWFAIAVKILVLLLSALGIATMWWAVFADVGVAVIAILNALRALKVSNSERNAKKGDSRLTSRPF